jgi:hypothetical protein
LWGYPYAFVASNKYLHGNSILGKKFEGLKVLIDEWFISLGGAVLALGRL